MWAFDEILAEFDEAARSIDAASGHFVVSLKSYEIDILLVGVVILEALVADLRVASASAHSCILSSNSAHLNRISIPLSSHFFTLTITVAIISDLMAAT